MNPEQDIDTVLENLYQSGRQEEWAGHPSSGNETVKKAKQKLLDIVTSARITELEKVPLDFENSALEPTEIWVSERLAELKNQLGESNGR